MLRPTIHNLVENGDGNTQVGQNYGTIVTGMDPALFVEEMRRKDARIDELIAKNEALAKQVGDLESQKLHAELAELRKTKEELAERLAEPEKAFRDHKARATQIESLLDDLATQQAVGESRIRSALEGFADLEYEEIDNLLEEIERQGIMQAAKAAYGRGLVAEDAIQWTDAARHYARSARLAPSFDKLQKASKFAQLSGDFSAAERFSSDLLNLAKKEGTPELLSTALNDHAVNRQALGHYADAEALCREALEIDEVTVAKIHPSYAAHLNNLANAVRAQGRHEEAEAHYLDVLAIDRITIGEKHPNYLTHLNNLAQAVRDQGRIFKAKKLFRKVVEMSRTLLGEKHPYHGHYLNNLAGVTREQGWYNDAEKLYREVLNIYRATLGEMHPDFASCLNNLGVAVRVQGRLTEAETLYREALEIDLATLGALHPNYLLDLKNLTNVMLVQGRDAEAKGLLRNALRTLEAALPPEHPFIQDLRKKLTEYGSD